MYREFFQRTMEKPAATFYTEHWRDNVTFRCDKVTNGSHVIYRLRTYCFDSNFTHRIIYSVDEADLTTALQRAEEMEGLISLSSALFSWIGI